MEPSSSTNMRQYESKSLGTTKKQKRKTVSSHQKDNVKRDHDMTSSSHPEDAVISRTQTVRILQQRHTTNTTTTTTTPKKEDKAAANKENRREITLRDHLKNARCLNNGHLVDELPTELEGCKWDAVLLCETWRQEQRERSGDKHAGHTYGCWYFRSKALSWNTLEGEMETKRSFRQSTSTKG